MVGLIDPERLRGTRGPQDGRAAELPDDSGYATGAPAVPGPKPPTSISTSADPSGMVPKVPSGTLAMPKLHIPKGPTSAPKTEYQEVGRGLGPAPTRERGATVGIGQELPGVSGRLTGLLATKSPYLQRARLRGRQAANRRGLMSSSIAGGASEAAAIDAALPIAQADAGIAAGERSLRSTEFQQARQHRVQQLMQQRDHRVQQLMQTQRLDHDAAQLQANREMQASLAQFDFEARRFLQDDTQEFQRGERVGTQDFQSAEAARQRAFQTGERTGSEQFAATEAERDRRAAEIAQERGISFQEAQAEASREFSGQQADLDRRAAEIAQERGISAQEAQAEAQREFAGREAELDRLQQKFMQEQGIDADSARQQAQNEFAGRQAELDRAAQLKMQEQGLSFDEAQAEASRELKQKIAVQTATQAAQDQYQTSLDRLSLNTDLPAEERARLEEHYAFLRDQAISAIEATYEVDLSWAQSTRPPPPTEGEG